VDFTALTVAILKGLSHIAGSYGMGIILLTVIVRMVMWPLNYSQQRSMKKMQELAPKIKELQLRYKSDPKVMQKKMMEIYKEHKFNPFGGCFPLLLQMPIFILLYTALISPQFTQIAGNSSFLFINRLDSTIHGSIGKSYDNIFEITGNDKFSTQKQVTVYLNNNKVEKVNIKNSRDAVKILGKEEPGKPIGMELSYEQIDMPFQDLGQIQKVEADINNANTRENEHLTFKKKDSILIGTINTKKADTTFHPDVLILVLLFGLTMWGSQKVMSSSNNAAVMDPSQKAMQDQMSKMMPIMMGGMFLFFPIPAGVLLYMVVSNIIQVIQTVVINKQIDKEKTSPQVIEKVILDNAKSVKGSRKGNVEDINLIEKKPSNPHDSDNN